MILPLFLSFSSDKRLKRREEEKRREVEQAGKLNQGSKRAHTIILLSRSSRQSC